MAADEVDLLLAGNDFFPNVDVVEVADDPVEELLKTAGLAGHLGWRSAENLAREVADLHKQAGTLMRRDRSTAPARSEWEEPLIDAAHRLEKRLHNGKKAARIEKLASGWIMEYDEFGQLLRGHLADEDEAA